MKWLLFGLLGLIAGCVVLGSLPPGPWDSPISLEVGAKRAVEMRLRDASSAEFSRIEVHRGPGEHDRTVCGRVNARNAFGGYTGSQPFVVPIRRQDDEAYYSAALLREDLPRNFETVWSQCPFENGLARRGRG